MNFFFNDTATTEIYTLSLHDALPIWIEAAQALIADEPPARDSLALAGFAARRLGKTVYDVEDVTYTVSGRGEDDDPGGPADPRGAGARTLFDHLTWHVGPGDRIGIVGVNGAGKTSLLKLLVGEAQPDSGRVVVGQTVAPAYLSQHVTELPPRSRVLEAVQDITRIARIGNHEISASTLAQIGRASCRERVELSGG